MKRLWYIIILILTLSFIALARFDPNTFVIKNYQTDEEWVIGGDCNVTEGGSIDIESGGKLKVAGVDVTAGLGTGASDSNKTTFANGGYVSNVDNNEIKIGENAEAFSWDFDANTVTIRNKTDITAYDLRAFPTMYLATIDACDITFDGVAITATPAELNKNAGVTAGTARASKVAVLGTANDLDYLKVTTFMLGAGKVTKSTTAENQVILPDANGYLRLSKVYSLATGTVPASSCWGGTYVSTSATDIDVCLPAPTAGMDISFMLMSAVDVNITAAANGNILYVTKRNAGPNSISSDEVAGSYIHLRAVDDANWFIMDANGTWSGIN